MNIDLTRGIVKVLKSLITN